ncbi:2-keto-4-pentenoate hydratase [Methylopila capsulata]|nr:fumarylacetoacetate hydrolase family protein [Methylopila capsulata]MBM7852281.1 2-keto-4-pentenoate hydratase [Methylopila capsulata]
MPAAAPAKIADAARLLEKARRSGVQLAGLPADLAPTDEAEAMAMHYAGVAAIGPIVGWKVGAPTPEAEPGQGALTASTIHESPAALPASALKLWAVEAEIAVRLGRDLPARETPYSREEVLAAVATWHPAIEVLDTAFERWSEQPALWRMADRQSHGLLILGPASSEPPPGPLDRAPVRLEIDGETIFEHEGGNTGGDPTRLLVALANRLRQGPNRLKARDVVTTGSATPFRQAGAGQTVTASFAGLGSATLTIGAG